MAGNSRISRVEQQRVVRQSIILIVLAIVFLGVFVFVLLPLGVRLFGLTSGSNTQITNKDGFPPQTPILNQLPVATNSAEIAVSGVGEAGTTATLVNSGTMVQEVDINEEGEFSFGRIQLQEGDNILTVVSADDDGQESVSKAANVVLDTQEPQLTISEPQEGATLTKRREQSVTVKGSTEAKNQAFVNGKVMFMDSAGNFTGTVQLQQGDNTLTILVIDQAGNRKEEVRTVKYQPE